MPETVPVGVRRRLDGGNPEPAESASEMGAVVAGALTGGGGRADVGDVLYHCSSGDTPIRFGDVDHVPVDWEGAWRISPSGGMETDGVDATEEL